jgi:hypothetical protein
MKRRDVQGNKEFDNDNDTDEMLKWMGICLLIYAGFFIFAAGLAKLILSTGANPSDLVFGCVVLLIIICSSRAFEDWKDRL